jgi:lysozyme
MTRKALFDAIRPHLPEPGFSKSGAIELVNRLADLYGLPANDIVLTPSTVAIDLIKKFEGCELTAYPDPGTGGDPWTVGWGATGEGIRKGVVWTQQQADERLRADVMRFAQGVATAIGDAPTTQHQFDACVSLAYNIGLKAFTDSTLLRLHKAGNYALAADQFARWNRAGGRILNGLTRRRAAEAELYRS